MRYSKEYKTIKKNVNWTFGIKFNSVNVNINFTKNALVTFTNFG